MAWYNKPGDLIPVSYRHIFMTNYGIELKYISPPYDPLCGDYMACRILTGKDEENFIFMLEEKYGYDQTKAWIEEREFDLPDILYSNYVVGSASEEFDFNAPTGEPDNGGNLVLDHMIEAYMSQEP